jgi:hypothetical protein
MRLDLKTILVLSLIILSLSPVLAGGASARKAPQEMVDQDIKRFEAMGGVYQPQGFVQMADQPIPYERFRRINSALLLGRVVYANRDNVRIWKYLYCGLHEVVVVELSVREAEGRRIPFAWQDCSVICETGGSCHGSDSLFIDITGDGKPEIMIPRMDGISLRSTGAGWIERRTFTHDIIPSWIKAEVGPDYRNIYPLGPEDAVPFYDDHPTALNARGRIHNDD